VEKIAAWCSDAILSQNGEDLQTAIREHICPADRIAHLGNGIDLTNFDPDLVSPATEAALRARLQLPVGTPVVGFVGRLAGRRKGVLDFFAAARAITARLPAARFLIVGAADSGKPDAVEPSAAGDYGIAERCIFVGHVPQEDLPPYYRLMDTLVLPSLFEGLPRVVMEASAMGVPSVVSDVKGNREAVEPGRNGLLVPLGDVPALTAAILHILENPEVAARFGAGGRSLAAERFDERVIFQRVRECYETQLRRKGLAHFIPGPQTQPLESGAGEKASSLLRT
jgi:glycosyltransferase involved in cell wall biosynthesis